MGPDPFKLVRRHLRLAANSLAAPRTTAYQDRVTTLEGELDPNRPKVYRGNRQLARREIQDILVALRVLMRPQQASATGVGKKLKQDPTKKLVGDGAVSHLESAIKLLDGIAD